MPEKNRDGSYKFEVGQDGLPMLPDMRAYEEESGYDDDEIDAVLQDFNSQYKAALADKTNREMAPKPPEKSSHQRFIEKAGPGFGARMNEYLKEHPDARERIQSFDTDSIPPGVVRIVLGHPSGPMMADSLSGEEGPALMGMDEGAMISRLLEIAEKGVSKSNDKGKEELPSMADDDIASMDDATFLAKMKELFPPSANNQRATMSDEEIAREEKNQKAYSNIMNRRDAAKGRRMSGAQYTRGVMA